MDDREEISFDETPVPRGLVLGALAGTVLVTVLLCGLAAWVLGAREAELRPSGRFDEASLGAPRRVAALRARPFAAGGAAALFDAQRASLARYRWLSRDVVSVPVDVAIELIVEGRAP